MHASLSMRRIVCALLAVALAAPAAGAPLPPALA